MRTIFKTITIFMILVLIISGFYVVFSYAENYVGNNTRPADQEKPTIGTITGDTTGTLGKITTIYTTFSDNTNVTDATIYFKKDGVVDWTSDSIIDGSYDLEIPKGSLKDWYYYITVDDEAGNGPVGNPSVDGSKYYTITVEKNVEDLVHNVFIEEGTATWCHNCPEVAEKLHELYESENYNFYYVSLVQDKNSNANKWLADRYNIKAYPSVYIDGGYDLVVGDQSLDVFKEKINKASKRHVPKIDINVTSELDANKSNIKSSVTIKNYDEQKYTGQLKLYLTERNSWQYYGGEGIYHYSFIRFLLDKKIELASGDNKNIETNFEVESYDPDNLMIIAVVFNSEPVEKSFNAFYADACDGSLVVENANLKPEVGITNPKKGRLHIFGMEVTATYRLNTILIGRTKISVEASDDSEVEKVEIYIDDERVAELYEKPYEYNYKSTPMFKFRHEIKVVAYDDGGKTSEEEINVIAFILL